MPRSDLVLFVTSADRPFTETERAFLEQIRGWGKKVVVVINKVDILEGERAGRGGRAPSWPTNARALLGFSPEIFPVSARLALRAKQGEPSVVGGEPLRGARALHPRRRSTRPAASTSSC